MPGLRFGVIKPCCIGDAVMALPVIDNLALAHPNSHIEVWCGRHTSAVFAGHPRVEKIVEIPDVPALRDIPGLILSLRSSSNDSFFVLDRSRLIAAACRMSGVRVSGSVRTEVGVPVHEIDRYLGTLKQAGIPTDVRTPSLPAGVLCDGAHKSLIGDFGGAFVTLHPGGARNPGSSMLSKRWPAGNWRSVVDWLEARSIPAVLTGSPDERELCASIAAGTIARVAAGRLTLIESAGLAASGLAFAGPDTGLAHLVAATGTPTIAIFGPTNPAQYGPRGENVTILAAPGSYQVGDTDLRKSNAKTGPDTSEVTVDQVVGALGAILDGSRADR